MSFIGDQQTVGRALCIAGLALAPFTTLFARHYSRTLYFAQFLSAVYLTFNTSLTKTPISAYLGYSSLDFMPEFTSKYCTSGDFSCTYGKLISPAIVWIGVAALMILIVKIVACKKREAKYLSFYNFFRGLMYWFYGPLIAAGAGAIIDGIKNSKMDNNFIAGIIIVVGFVAISFAEIIAYKVAQRAEENPFRKWVEFFSHYMVGPTLICVVVYSKITSSSVQSAMKYLIPNVFIGLFALFYIIKYKFTFKVVERIFQFVQDGIIIAVLDIMVFQYQYIIDYHIDFYALAIVLAIELLEVFIKFIMFCKKGNDDDDEGVVSP